MEGFELFLSEHQFLAYIILFAGMFIESDIFYISSAILAHNKQLNWGIVFFVGFFGMIISDFSFYFLGRYSRNTKLGEWMTKKFERHNKWLGKNFIENYAVLAFFTKFIAYLNRFAPFLAGWHKYEYKKFFRVHLLTGLLWIVIMTTMGVLFGAFLDLVGPKWILHRIWIVALLVFVILLIVNHVLKKILSKRI